MQSERILIEYKRRAEQIHADRYAPWDPAEAFMRAGRERLACQLLRRADVFPIAGEKCLEVGYGKLGWLGTLISWGLRESDLSGMELDETRAEVAKRALPGADLRVGDATKLPWSSGTFKLIVCSTVFTSILDPEMRQELAREMIRVLADDGGLLWYDFRVNNPKNKNVRSVSQRELLQLFAGLEGTVKSVTLAPPLARLIVPRSWLMASMLETLVPLRSHLVALFVKSRVQ